MVEGDFFRTLRKHYSTIDEEMGQTGFACEQCAGCCDSSTAGFQPQPYLLEVDLIRDYLRTKLQPWPEADAGGGYCLFLDGKRCSVHAVRPFACRVFSCTGQSQVVAMTWKLRIERLCQEYARAMHEPFRGFPLCMYFRRRRSKFRDWLDIT